MQSSSAKVLKGLSIAIIVISILSICANLFIGLAMGGAGIIAAQPEVQEQINADVQLDPSSQQALDDMGLTQEDAVVLTTGLLALGGIGLVITALLCILCLVSGIIGFRASSRPEKAGSAKVWMIVGAVAGVISFNFLAAILCIIAAVFAHKFKNEGISVPYGTPYQQ